VSIDDGLLAPPKPQRTPKPERPPLRVADPDGRPDVFLTADAHLATESMAEALRSDPDIYQRASELVHVVRHEDEEDGRHAPGTPLVRACPQSWVGDRISAYARCLTKGKKGEWKHVAPPPARIRAVVERGSWRGIRHLDGVIEAPALRPDGTVIQEAGYDAATRSLYAPNAAFPPIETRPTHSDAALAYAHLADVFRDFPYVAPEHRAASVAALLTLLARPAILGSVPCWVFDAASKRSGKSLQMDVIHLIATGRPCSRMTFPADDDKELESVLASYALVGARVVPFDNVARPFGGAPLDKCVTTVDQVDLRVLGRSELRTLPWRAVILASGNNVGFRDDMLPRVLSPRLESPLENPELLEARDLKAFALARRASLVADALTILRAYVVAGRPAQGILWGGFEQWAALVPSALVWAGAPNPMGARRGLAGDEDPIRAAEGAVVEGWARLCAATDPAGLTVGKALATIYPPPKRDEEPDAWGNLREALDELTAAKPGFTPATSRVSAVLRRLKARPIAGKKLVTNGATGGVARWRVI